MHTPLQARIKLAYAALAIANVAAWAWAHAVLAGSPALLGTAFLAYTFGIRHALDPDHIAAIDNVTRKLVGEGKLPIGTGLYFALGHATVVFLGVLVIVLATHALRERFDHYRALGAVIGTWVSTVFLLLVAMANTASLRQSMHGGTLQPRRGVLARMCQPVLSLIDSSWLMMPLGFLFGLGFESATEIALLSSAAQQSAGGAALGTVLVFPSLFTAGMLAVDTTDGILMLGAYRHAGVAADRLRRYGIAITALSTLMAWVIGGAQALALLHRYIAFAGPLEAVAGALETHLDIVGYLFIVALALTWLACADASRRHA